MLILSSKYQLKQFFTKINIGESESKIAQSQWEIQAQKYIQYLENQDKQEIESQNENVITKGFNFFGIFLYEEII